MTDEFDAVDKAVEKDEPAGYSFQQFVALTITLKLKDRQNAIDVLARVKDALGDDGELNGFNLFDGSSMIY